MSLTERCLKQITPFSPCCDRMVLFGVLPECDHVHPATRDLVGRQIRILSLRTFANRIRERIRTQAETIVGDSADIAQPRKEEAEQRKLAPTWLVNLSPHTPLSGVPPNALRLSCKARAVVLGPSYQTCRALAAPNAG
jgi:hypothetical protein